MDGRKWWVLALSLLGSCLGCVGSTSWQPPAGDSPRDSAPVQHTEKSKRPPRPATLVALGQFRANTAADPKLTPEQQQQRREQACQAFQQALQLDSDFVPAFLALAHLYSTTGEYEHALGAYNKALKVHPKDPSIWFELAMCHSREKQWQQACESLRQALALSPDNRQYTATLGFCLARMGRYDDSLAVFIPVCGKAEACYKVARMAQHLRQNDVSKQLLRAALQEQPKLAGARQMLAQLEGTSTGTSAADSAVPVGYEKPEEGPCPGDSGK